MSLLSVLTLTRKEIRVLLMPNFAVLYDLRNHFSILGYEEQDEDGLLYGQDDGTTNPTIYSTIHAQPPA